MAMKIVILEDNDERQAEMRRCLQDRFHQYELVFFADAAAMVDYLATRLDDTIAICLDHDLELIPDGQGRPLDPGTGRVVADFLASQSPRCPVVIHTSNSAAAVGMEMVLQEAGWKTYRVLPMNDLEWITTDWFRSVRRAIVGPTNVKSNRAPSPRS
jgi:Cyclic-phosphate processing Receiver domain